MLSFMLPRIVTGLQIRRPICSIGYLGSRVHRSWLLCACVLLQLGVTADGAMRRTAPSAPYTLPTWRLSRPSPFQKLGAENHMLQLNIYCSWWWAYVPETCGAKNTQIKLPCCIKLSFRIISWGRCTVKQPSRVWLVLQKSTKSVQSYHLMFIGPCIIFIVA